jgi:phage/plasmid-like protein (TIGR03299 family)
MLAVFWRVFTPFFGGLTMAHELVFRNGQAQMFAVGETPWHREGKVLTDAPSWDVAFTLAEFDYPLEKRPYFRPVDVADLSRGFAQSADAFYVYRPDINKSFGSVGADYEIVPNRQAFEVLKPLVDEGILKLETGGVLRDGADAWLMGRWDLSKFGTVVREVFEKDGGLLPYATVMANHSGRRGILLGSTSIRVVCANTLGMAERQADGQDARRWVNVTHKHGAVEMLKEAAEELFLRVLASYDTMARQYRLLMETPLPYEAFDKLVLDVVAPDPRQDKAFNPSAKLAETVVARADRKRAEVRRLWTDGKGHTGEQNAWFAYNGVAECLDHNRDLWPTRSGAWRTASLLTGQLSQMKAKVVENLVDFATSA